MTQNIPQGKQGISGVSRRLLSRLLRERPETMTPADAAQVLDLPRNKAAKLLADWAKRGWLARVRQGLYVPVPLDSISPHIIPDDPWLIAVRVFEPCYIGGWSAAEHWDLTEQIFRTTVVLTTRRVGDRNPDLLGLKFRVKTVSTQAFFGLKNVWRNSVQVPVSDPSRTIVDLFDDPSMGGGIRPSADILRNYLASKTKDLPLIIEYADRLGNRAVFKRLGFLMEQVAPTEQQFISECKARLSAGNAKLDPTLPAEKLITRWRLWVPRTWARRIPGD